MNPVGKQKLIRLFTTLIIETNNFQFNSNFREKKCDKKNCCKQYI